MTTVSLRRKNTLNLFREAGKLSSFDEYPVLRSEIDPQMHVSRNSVDQPFHLICEKDSVLVLISGKAIVQFASGAVRFFELEPGDFVYVPGGMPHRILVGEEGIHVRYKARESGLEAVAWYCKNCGAKLDEQVWDTAVTLPQEGYEDACQSFNSQIDRRTCTECGSTHDVVDLTAFRWKAVAQMLHADATK